MTVQKKRGKQDDPQFEESGGWREDGEEASNENDF